MSTKTRQDVIDYFASPSSAQAALQANIDVAGRLYMADLQITDEFGLNTSVQLRDDSPLAKAKLTHLSSITQALKDEIDKPIDQTSLKDVTIGVECSTPRR